MKKIQSDNENSAQKPFIIGTGTCASLLQCSGTSTRIWKGGPVQTPSYATVVEGNVIWSLKNNTPFHCRYATTSYLTPFGTFFAHVGYLILAQLDK